ncbi:Holo-[acyl-carrier-protein] synthase [Paraconexibacter sp. AEG42_29]|uniref:Holo-[acyl-carrier-protein] synthase n=1 Tax=Paraconexibacter sp. AEG42_29 TaxID=2997339 RepID=A0AAU7B2M8_9ACTN
MSVRGLGIDVVDVPAFAVQLTEPGSGFVAGTFTAGEQAASQAGPGTPALAYAARFAAKEAFVKAWSVGRLGRAPQLGELDLREVELVSDPWSRPSLVLHGQVRDAVREALGPDVAIHVSLSHDGPAAVAVVLLETPD